MKLERLPEYLTTATAVILGALISYWFGLLAGEGQIGTILALILAACFLAVLLSFKQNFWVLIPICAAFAGSLPQVPLHPGFSDVVVVAVLLTTFLLTAVKAIRFKPRVTLVDIALWATLLYVALTWLRHPTGGYILNSDRVGGRAYLNAAIACCAYFALSRASIPVHWNPAWLAACTIGASVLQGLLMVATHFLPKLGLAIGRYYEGVEAAETGETGAGVDPMAESMERSSFMQALALPVVRWMIAWFRPLTMINPLYPFRTFFFALSLLSCLLAGFRSSLITVVGFFLIASFLRRGAIEAARVAGLIFLAALVLVGSSYVVRLPFAIQRSLTILPGNWDEVAKVDAHYSAEWRFMMWRLMLSSDRYIENKWLGDGFGFSMQQFQQMTSNQGTLQAQENFMITGQVHSGPISAIRFVGYIGLGLWLVLLCVMAREAYKLCRATLGTSMQVFTWYLCLPIIWEPFNYVFIFGSYDYALPQQVFWVGILKMLRNSVEARQVGPEEAPAPRREIHRVQRPALAGASLCHAEAGPFTGGVSEAPFARRLLASLTRKRKLKCLSELVRCARRHQVGQP